MSLEIQNLVELAPLTTFNVGGKAKYFACVNDSDELDEALDYAKINNLKISILGGGSNVLISDQGFDGLVIQINIKGKRIVKDNKEVLVEVSAGDNWDEFVAWAVDNNWAGLENLSGIPGTVGGALVQNIGAYNQTLADKVESLQAIEISSGKKIIFTKNDCKFKYRESIFKSKLYGKYIILSVLFRLIRNGQANLKYQDYRSSLKEKLVKNTPNLKDARKVILAVREQKGMLINPTTHLKSAGSFFKNPEVSQEKYLSIKYIAEKMDPSKAKALEPWHWQLPNNLVKIACGFLLEFTKYNKGYIEGRVGISPKHSLAIINLGGARATDILNLANNMQKSVYQIFKVKIEPEVVFLGFKEQDLLK